MVGSFRIPFIVARRQYLVMEAKFLPGGVPGSEDAAELAATTGATARWEA